MRWILAAACLIGVATAATADTAWKQYSDASGVSIRYPAGWTVERHGYTLLVRSKDHAALAMIQAFEHSGDETALSHLGRFTVDQASLFPHGRVEQIQPQACNAGDEAVATVDYRSATGQPAKARALCLVQPQAGFLFVIAAPTAQLSADRPILMKVLTSFGFQGGPSKPAAVAASPHFVPWADPVEKAFTTEVPAGWKVQGGTYRFGLMDPRTMILLNSPDGQISIMRGDCSIPTFEKPNPISMKLGQQEGAKVSPGPGYTGILLNYRSAQQFNQLYVTERLNKVLDNVTIVGQQDLPELAAQLQANAQAQFNVGGIRFSVSAARATFTATSKETGKPLAGVLTSWTRDAGGIWKGCPTLGLYAADASAPAHEAVCDAVIQQVLLKETVNPEWQDQQLRLAFQLSKEQSEAIWKMMNDNAKAFAERSEESNRAFRESMQRQGEKNMEQFKEHEASRDVETEKWCDFLLDRQKLINPETGEITKQASTLYHYQNGDTVLNTNVQLIQPLVNWVPLQTFP